MNIQILIEHDGGCYVALLNALLFKDGLLWRMKRLRFEFRQ